MKVKILFIIILVFGIVLISHSILYASNSSEKQGEKSQIELVNEQIQGTWFSKDNKTYSSKWSFLNGHYVCETFKDGELMENPTLGVYIIGTEAIYTITIDQEKNVEGSIPYIFENGHLTLKPRNDAEITKVK